MPLFLAMCWALVYSSLDMPAWFFNYHDFKEAINFKFASCNIVSKTVKQEKTRRFFPCSSPNPVERTASSQKQDLCRVTRISIRQHVSSKNKGRLLLFIYSQISPTAIHVGHFSRDSTLISLTIAYKVI